jgi:hypothetical protein
MKKSILSNPAFRYIFEIIIIVFSVTLSFYIQDVINKREKIYFKDKTLNGILVDLQADKRAFKQASNVIYDRIRLIEDVLDGDINNEKISALMTFWGFLGQNSNYKSLISTGAIEYIETDGLTLRLSGYYEGGYTALNGESDSYNTLYLDLMSYMKKTYVINSMKKVEKGEGSGEFLKFIYSTKELKKMKNDSELRNHFFELKRIIHYYATMFENGIERANALSNNIERELLFRY